MKQNFIITLFIAVLPFTANAQDDMYFVPSKKKAKVMTEAPRVTYHSGSNRNVDEYNRQGTYFHETDSAGNDIITFDGLTGAYPDSVFASDFTYTKQMSRFDDYQWNSAYREGYSDALSDTWSWSWHSPWYYDRWMYDPFYYGYGWNYGWNWSWSLSWGWHNHPWYYPNYGYHRPPHHFYPSYGSSYRPYKGITGTRNSGKAIGSNRNNSFKKDTGSSTGSKNNGSFRRSSNSNKYNNSMRDQVVNGSFGNSNSNSSSFNRNSNGGSFNSGSSGGSFNRGGSFSGGSRSGGSSGGGGSFKGRR